MPPLYLPRVGAFPIFPEDHFVTVAGTSTNLPLKIRKDFPLKDRPAPNFVLTDQLGRQCSLHDTIRLGRPIILFFFPLAGSPHCTQESCLFRDAIEVTPIFNVLQAIVIGISQDPPERAKRFTDEHRLSYPILYDHKRRVMDLYGVGRTTFGLVDNRATFIIDPIGTVRGLAEGVLNAIGHLKFAERWLIRMEDELSERSKQHLEYIAKEGDMIAKMDSESDKLLQVVYGEEGSALHGGLDAVPRYGGASVAPPKQPTSPRSRRRYSMVQERPSRGRTNTRETVETNGSSGGGHHEKNMWKNWKHLIAQLSSPDDVPPPIVTARIKQSPSTTSFIDKDPSDSPMRSRESNPTRTLSRRRAKSPFGKRAPRPREVTTTPPPPVPQVTPPRPSNGKTGWVDPLDIEAEDVKTSDSMRNSLSSTPPSSFSHARIGSQSSSSHHKASNNNPLIAAIGSGSSSGHGRTPSSAAHQSIVTSEVLKVDGPILMRRTSRKFSPSPIAAQGSQGADGKINGNGNAPLLSTLQQRDSPAEEADPRRSSGPSDVPEDADPEEDELSSQVSLQTKPLPQTPSPQKPTRQLAASPSPSPLSWAKGLGRHRASSTDGRSSPLGGMSRLRSTKKSQPPAIVTNPYATASWDAGYGPGSMTSSPESKLASRPRRISMETHKNTSPSVMQRSASALSHIPQPIPVTLGEGFSHHPFSNGRRSRTHSLAQSQGPEGLSESPRKPTMSTPGRSVASSLVLESLALNNHSQHSLHFLDNNSNNPHHHSSDDTRSRLIPRKAPPPMHAPPQPPIPTQIIGMPLQQQVNVIGRPLLHRANSSNSTEEDGSPAQPYVHSFVSESRRASAAGSVRSTGTFG